MNTLSSRNVYMRSIATRRQHLSTSKMLGDITLFLKSLAYDLILVETAGIGQSDSEIVDLVDFSLYIMTSDYGAASQLEKIDMLDFADMIILNKFDRRGTEDALRDVRKQWQRNHNAFQKKLDDIPVYPTIASQFNDPGVNWAFENLCKLIVEKKHLNKTVWLKGLPNFGETSETQRKAHEPKSVALIPGSKIRYLAEISEQAREINVTMHALRQNYESALNKLDAESINLLKVWPRRKKSVEAEKYTYKVRGKEVKGSNSVESLSGLQIPKIATPKFDDWGEQLKFLLSENLPGSYPFTAGVFPYRRTGEDPTRMFAGEGTPEQTNRRFHYLSKGQDATRLSTAFDSVTLYGSDPDLRLDIWGKIGNAGVSVATLDDMKKLFFAFWAFLLRRYKKTF